MLKGARENRIIALRRARAGQGVWAVWLMSASAPCSRTLIMEFAPSADCHRGALPLFWTVEPRPGKWSFGVKGEDSV